MKNYSAVEENIKEVEEKEVEENIKEFKYKEYLLYDNTLIIDNDDIELAAHIAMIKKLVKRIIKSEGELFSIKEYSKGSKTIDCKIPDFFKQMKIFTDIAIIQNIALRFPLHCLNPYIELFIKNMTAEANLIQQWYNSFRAYELYDDTKLVECVDAFNAFAKNIKSEADSPEFTETLINYRRPLNKHFKSLIDYIDELFER
ncbi:MAG: hypothetical protein ACXVEB_14585, partial [Bacteroidia bacterium]